MQRSIMAGETVTGASVFRLERGMDTGPVFAVEERPTGAHETAGDVLHALAMQAPTSSSARSTGSPRAAPSRVPRRASPRSRPRRPSPTVASTGRARRMPCWRRSGA